MTDTQRTEQLIQQCFDVAAKQFPNDENGRRDHLVSLLATKLREVAFAAQRGQP